MKRITMLMVLVLFVMSQNGWGALPRTISYQGVLTDNVGVIVPNAYYSITFRLYDAASSGTLLWEETQSVLVTSGRYEVILGNIVSMDPLSFDDKYWLTLKVESDSEMDSRIELTGTGYALNARTVEDDAITGSKIADGHVVRSITIPPSNTLRDDVWFKGGTNVTITQVADTLFISATGSGGGNTLDQAYDQGGAGVGRTIDVDAGSVVLDATANGAGTPALRIQGDDLYEPGIELDNNSKTWRLHAQSSGQFGITKGDVFTPLRINENSFNNALVMTDIGVGINTNGPIEMLQVVGALNIGTTANSNPGTIRWTGSDFEGHTATGWQSLTEAGGLTLPFSGSTVSTSTAFRVTQGGDGLAGSFHNSDNDSSKPALSVTTYGHGPALDVHSNTGPAAAFNQVVEIGNIGEPGGLDIDGGEAGMGETMSLGGRNRHGNLSVLLPGDAVSAFELLNEPGAVNANSSTSIWLTGGVDVLLSQTLTAPTDGYALVIATADVTAIHTALSNSAAILGVSDQSTSFPTNQRFYTGVPGSAPSDTYEDVVTVHGLFPVSAGANTFYFLGQEYSGSYSVYDQQLTVVFLSTAYGTVDPAVAGGPVSTRKDGPVGAPLNDTDIRARQLKSEADNLARIERELNELREEMRRLKEERYQRAEIEGRQSEEGE